MALGTIASRVTGFLRTAVIVYALGTVLLGDSYNIANTTPNIVYELMLGGILTSVVVPVLVRASRTDDDGGEAYAQRLLTLVAVVLGVLTIVAVLFAPAIIAAYGTKLSDSQRNVAEMFARFFLPQILFYGVGATIGAILNTRGRFAAPMWTPVLNNLVVIATGVIFLAIANDSPNPDSITHGETLLLGIGTTLGIVVQTVALLPSLRATGFRFRPRFDWRNTGLGHAGRLASWVIVYVVANQIGLLVVVNLAGYAGRLAQGEGVAYGAGYTPYFNAFQLFSLPHAIVAVSVITALLPRMSGHAADGRLDQLRADLSSGLRLTAVAVVPATAAFIVLGPQLATVLFAHRNATVADAHFIGVVLGIFALGLIPFSAFQIHLRAFYALQDTKTPALINCAATATNIVADLLLFAVLPAKWKVVGLALGFAVSYVVAVSLTSRLLGERLGGLDAFRVVRTYVRLGVASALGGSVAWLLAVMAQAVLGHGFSGSLAACVLGVGSGVAVFAWLALRMNVEELAEVVRLVRRPRGSRRPESVPT
jgi:putative peptidoglycan lipid II flippase